MSETLAGADWTTMWDTMLAAVGTDLSQGRTVRGADPIEASTIRRAASTVPTRRPSGRCPPKACGGRT
jgi:hypothetical protein